MGYWPVTLPSAAVQQRGCRRAEDAMGRTKKLSGAVIGTLLLLGGLTASAGAASAAQACGGGGSVSTVNGTLPDGATYEIQCPAGTWNGTLFLYSHGYVVPGSANPAQDVGDPVTGGWLLSHGYALAGSSYATTGWAIQSALPDQISTLDAFDSSYRHAQPHHRLGPLARRHHHRRAHPGLPAAVHRRAADVRRAVRRRSHLEHRARCRVRVPAAHRPRGTGGQHHQPARQPDPGRDGRRPGAADAAGPRPAGAGVRAR